MITLTEEELKRNLESAKRQLDLMIEYMKAGLRPKQAINRAHKEVWG